MTNVALLRQAFLSGIENSHRLDCFRAVESWAALPFQEASSRMQKALDEFDTRLVWGTLLAMNLKLQHDMGIVPKPNDMTELNQLMAEVAAGTAPAEQARRLQHLQCVWNLAGALLQQDPTVAQVPPADMEKSKLQMKQHALFARLDPVQAQTVPGAVTDESIQTFKDVVADAEKLIAETDRANTGLPALESMTGGAARTLAGCYAIQGMHKEAIQAYQRAARHFEKAGEGDEVAVCQMRGLRLANAIGGQLDKDAADALKVLRDVGSTGDRWVAVDACVRLSDVAREAGDTFEARERADQAAIQLEGIGYADPAKSSAEAAMDAWIATAVQGATGTAVLKRITQVTIWYTGILGARFGERVSKDKAGAEAIEKLSQDVNALAKQLRGDCVAADQEVQRGLAAYYPAVHAAPAPAAAEDDSFIQKCRRIDAAVMAITEAANERDGKGDPMDDLVEHARALQKEADVLNSREYESKTRLIEAYVLDRVDRMDEVIQLSREARKRLLASRPARLSSLSQAYERFQYFESLTREMGALVRSKRADEALQLGEAAIADYETGRYQLKSEYRQSAVLGWIAEVYMWTIFSAFELKRWDNMLRAMDLIKARAAVYARLVKTSRKERRSALEREFRRLSRITGDDAAVQERRRDTWDLLVSSRAQSGSAVEMPQVNVASLQRSLQADEALIAYHWIHETVAIAVAVDRDRFEARKIVLNDAALERMNDFSGFVQGLGRSNSKMDKYIAKLGEILLPDFLREFLRGKRRVIFSPHRVLHLFPFHAAPWEGGFVGSEFAVRYVPNFSSLLLPWKQTRGTRLLAIGVTEFENNVAKALPNVGEDVRAIRKFYRQHGRGVKTLLGQSATRYRFDKLQRCGDLAAFRCIHFGTHGLSVYQQPNEPLESRLLLRDGALDAMDIANLRLNAELVVMSACHSGERALRVRDFKELPGDDIFGLQAALFRAGVRSVLGSMWLVETKSASAMTRAFHRHFAAGEAAEIALQQAVKEYLADTSLPAGVYYWAPFFITSMGAAAPRERNYARDDAAL